MYAAGRIPGSFFRREGRPSETAILLCRLTDRPLRPLFPSGFRNPVQIVLSPLGCDGETLMAPLAITAASAALSISDIDFQEPVAAVTIGLIDDELVVNPTHSQMQESQLNLQVAGTRDNILMVEAGADQVPEDVMLDALRLSHDAMQPLIDVIGDMQRELGKPKFKDYKLFTVPEQVSERVSEIASIGVGGLIADNPDRAAYDAGITTLKQQVQDSLEEELADESSEFNKGTVGEAFSGTVKKVVRQRILDQGVRSDGRDTTTVRPISVQVGRIPRVHGSGLFQRGETQVLTVATLGTPFRRPAHGLVLRRRGREDLHAPLQLPTLLDGRGLHDARSPTARDWPRCPGGTRRGRRGAGRLPLHPPPRVRVHEQQRFPPAWPPSVPARCR